MDRSPTSHRSAACAASPLTPEALESRVLFSALLTAGTTTLAFADINGDGADDQILFARTRQARRLLAESGITAAHAGRHSSLLVIDGADDTLLGGPVSVPGVGGQAPLLATADFNRDGRTDLALAPSGRAGGAIQILFGDGAGGFSRGRAVAAPGNLTSLAASDVNADGLVDLVATSTLANTGPRRVGGSGSTIMPDFRFELENAGNLLVAPATTGGVTAEAGGGTGLGVAGTFLPQPGATAEAGGGVAPAGSSFGDVPVDDSAAVGSTDLVTVLFGNGNGTFRSTARRRR